MLRKLAYFIYSNELLLGSFGLIATFYYYIIVPGPVTFIRLLPGILSWICVFLIGDAVNRHLGEGSIFPHRANQLNKLRRLAAAALIMNIIADVSGGWLLKLWYYPSLNNPYLYIFVFAPVGYILYGLLLYVYYRLFKRHWDRLVRPGRPSKSKRIVFWWLIHLELIVGAIGVVVSIVYYEHFMKLYGIVWYAVSVPRDVSVNIWYFFLLWMSLFFLLEYACYFLKRETFTRDLVRGNILPFISILLASAVVIVFFEFYNAPFHMWIYSNWPDQQIQFLGIPLVAYILWPTQYLLLLPIIRLFDGKNEENVW